MIENGRIKPDSGFRLTLTRHLELLPTILVTSVMLFFASAGPQKEEYDPPLF